MKGKIFKRATVTFLALSMVGTSLLADIGIVGLSEDFSLTANAADTETVTLHFFDSATSKLEDINIPIDSEYTFRSPLEVFKSDKIPDGYRFKYWKRNALCS